MDDERAQELGRLLRQRREALSLSTRQLAERAKMEQSTVVRVERGNFASPRPDVLARLAEALGLTLADVFAMADYAVPHDLPSLQPYLRTKYRGLPEEATKAIEAYAQRLARRHGVDLGGPAPGEDEQPEKKHQRTKGGTR